MSVSSVKYMLGAVVAMLLVSACAGTRLRKADKAFAIGEYYAAAELYNTAQRSISNKDKKKKAEVLFKMGEAYRLSNNVPKASRAYARAITSKCDSLVVYLYYAQMLHANGQYGPALKNYKLYLKHFPESEVAKSGAEACEQVAEWKKHPTRFVVKGASHFNSRRNSEFSPAYVGLGGESIVITTNRDNKLNKKNSAITGLPNNNLFFTKKNAAGEWEPLTLFEGEFNTRDDEGSCCFSKDGKRMYFTRCRVVRGQTVGAEIYVSQRSGAQWSTPQKVQLFKDSTISVAHPALSPDGEYLYFVSDNPKGFGGKDIWRCSLKQDNGTAIPENLGAAINTAADEMFPTFDAKGVLYFSSNGRAGFGGLDIYRCVKDSLGVERVENMGWPINSNADDFGMTFEGEAMRGFFASNRQQRKGYDKIWSFYLPEIVFSVEGIVRNSEGDALGDAVVKIVGNKGTNIKQKAKKDGAYRFALKRGERYVMLATGRGYLNQSHALSTDSLNDSKQFKHNFDLLSVSKPVKMDNIFYEFGKWDLTTESKESLKSLVQLLNDNPNITIEVAAHTDMKGTEAFNAELSEKRAKSVVDFLVDSGIERERLSFKGYGKSHPVVVDKALMKKYRFLRDGQVLDAKSCELLTEEQKAIVDQINRRTEFRVVKTTYNLY